MAKALRGTLRVVQERTIGVQEASAVAQIGKKTFLVVDDEKGLFRCRPDSDPVALAAGKGLKDLEGLCIDEARGHVYLLTERDGSVWRFKLNNDDLTNGKRLGKLPRLNKEKNQGWEGISFSRAGTLGDSDELIACHQVSPRRIAIFDAKTLTPRISMRLPKQARKVLGDLNDIAIHPKTKHLFVVSGKAGKLGELRIKGKKLELVRVYPLKSDRDDVPEGVTFGAGGRMWIVTDGEGMLRELRLNA